MRRVLAALLMCVGPAADAHAQTAAAPSLTRPQRAALEAAVGSVAVPDSRVEGRWQHHVLRASDGSHYVAVTVDVPADTAPPDAGVLLYVRLSPRPTPSTPGPSGPLRSAVAEWLAGQRATPLAAQPARMMGVQRGEMPIGGTQAMAGRGDSIAAAESSVALRMLMRDRERAREREEADAAERRAVLEGRETAASVMLPFEDFDVRAHPLQGPDGHWRFTRAIVAGPGEFDLTLSWAVPGARPLRARSVRLALSLPAATADGFDLSAPILATSVALRQAPFPPDQQAAHPFALGTLDITPREDTRLTNSDRLAVVWQAINPTPGPDGKPDISVGLRLYRQTDTGLQQVAMLSPLTYDARTVPADFDLRTGQPLFLAMAAPLAGLARGPYVLRAQAVDRLSRASVTREVPFTIRATTASLLADAPSPTWAFRRDSLVRAVTLSPVLFALEPLATTDETRRLMAATRRGAFVEVVPAPDGVAEDGRVRALLRVLARYALGDTPASLAAALNAPGAWPGPLEGPARWLLGAVQAATGADRDALSAWQAAMDAGLPAAAVTLPMAEAALRLRQTDRVPALLARVPVDDTTRAAAVEAAAHLLARRYAEAASVLERAPAPRPAAGSGEPDVAFLQLHAWFGVLASPASGNAHATRARFDEASARYLREGGAQVALVREWQAALTVP